MTDCPHCSAYLAQTDILRKIVLLREHEIKVLLCERDFLKAALAINKTMAETNNHSDNTTIILSY